MIPGETQDKNRQDNFYNFPDMIAMKIIIL